MRRLAELAGQQLREQVKHATGKQAVSKQRNDLPVTYQHLHYRTKAIEPKHAAEQLPKAIEVEPAVSEQRPPMRLKAIKGGECYIANKILVKKIGISLENDKGDAPGHAQHY